MMISADPAIPKIQGTSEKGDSREQKVKERNKNEVNWAIWYPSLRPSQLLLLPSERLPLIGLNRQSPFSQRGNRHALDPFGKFWFLSAFLINTAFQPEHSPAEVTH